MKLILISVFLLMFSSLLVSCAAEGAESTAGIRGRITGLDADAGAQVLLKKKELPIPEAMILCEAHFGFEGLAPGQYELVVNKNAWSTWPQLDSSQSVKRTVHLENGKMLEVDINFD
ncbi:MAG: hypothetical protein RL885_31645 [Planctomycetota bacterium]